uniref:Uncharacterized protein n=1 Tax=Glycine max TaxID=3847 RepID=C6T697_SOYBN|nr:unknown [Glycine max]
MISTTFISKLLSCVSLHLSFEGNQNLQYIHFMLHCVISCVSCALLLWLFRSQIQFLISVLHTFSR